MPARWLMIAFLAIAAAGYGGRAVAAPATWHVSPSGSDSADGSLAMPFLTIQHAVDVAAEGDTVRLFDGSYAGAGNAPVAWRDKGLVLDSLGGDPQACVIECAGQDGFRFVDTNLQDTHALTIRGLSFANADTAVAVLRTGYGYTPRVWARLSDCVVRDGATGVAAHGGWLLLDGCTFSGNASAGVSGGYIFGLTMDNCEVRGNGEGLAFTQMNSFPAAEVNASAFVGNGIGIRYWQEGGGMTLRSCRVDSSTVGNGIRATSDFEALRLEGCDINGNAGNGIANAQGTAVIMTGGGASGNGLCGIAMAPGDVALRLAGARLAGNGGWGVGPYAAPAGKGAGSHSADKDPAHDIDIVDCDILANGAGGVSLLGAYDPVAVRNSTIAGNVGPGLSLGSTKPGAGCEVEGVTVVDNQGDGLELTGGAWGLERALVTGNAGQAVVVAGAGTTITVGCSDLFGNLGGDWTGPLLPLLGTGGNVQADPLYCDAGVGNWTLREDSPAAAEGSGGCGLIGRLGVGCPAPPSLVAPVPGRGLQPGAIAAVHAVFPNPFNPRTTIPYSLAGAGAVRLAVYDVAGRHVRTLVDGAVEAGDHLAAWDGCDERGVAVGSGVYLARLQMLGGATAANASASSGGAPAGDRLVVRMHLLK